MKLQIAFDLTDLDQAIAIAEAVETSADIIEVGSLLIYKHGVLAIQRFKERFPQKVILADTKIVDRSKDAVTLFAQSGADWITVMAGANKNVIHTACTIAHALGKKVMLDLIDSSSLGQSALEAKSLGADALMFHKPLEDDPLVFLDRWDMVKGNTQLPVFISTALSRESLPEILSINPAGLVLGPTITQSQDPQQEAAYFANALHT
jgi:3-hexulose-6-phosphate synthase